MVHVPAVRDAFSNRDRRVRTVQAARDRSSAAGLFVCMISAVHAILHILGSILTRILPKDLLPETQTGRYSCDLD